MAKAKRDVQFPRHRNSSSSATRPRRPSNSFSDVSASSGEKGSAGGNGALGKGMSPPPTPMTEFEKKKQTFVTRTIWTLVMIMMFFCVLLAGHIYVIMVITAVQILSFKEVSQIINVPSRARSVRFTKSLNWYFFGTAVYFLDGESIIYYFKHIVLVDRILLPFATHHRFISFIMYIFGFVFFVGTLQKGHYRFQFTQFAWTHLALFLMVVQSHFVINNVFEGMIWFLLPVLMVITNDIFAYLCGMAFGRTQLIKLSPKKTVEGFVGAWICTIIFGFVFANIMMQYSYFTCPVNDLGANFFTGLQCQPNRVFLPKTYRIPFVPATWTQFPRTLTVEPMQLHILVFASFASLIAPFGGFFASGIKRTFKIKDFGDSIPGHGGITDRMDCQFIMGTLTYMYYQSFIATPKTSVGSIIELAVTGLNPEEQVEVVRGLAKYLVGQGLVQSKVFELLGGDILTMR